MLKFVAPVDQSIFLSKTSLQNRQKKSLKVLDFMGSSRLRTLVCTSDFFAAIFSFWWMWTSGLITNVLSALLRQVHSRLLYSFTSIKRRKSQQKSQVVIMLLFLATFSSEFPHSRVLGEVRLLFCRSIQGRMPERVRGPQTTSWRQCRVTKPSHPDLFAR